MFISKEGSIAVLKLFYYLIEVSDLKLRIVHQIRTHYILNG